MSKHTPKKKVIKKSVADTTRVKKQITRDNKRVNKLISTPAFQVGRVILPGSQIQKAQDRLKANRKALKKARSPKKR